MSSIVLEQVSFSYKDTAQRRKKHRLGEEDQALKGIDLTIPHGQFLCLIGHSGCGKTTMLRLIAGLNKPTAGSISIGDKPVHGAGLDRAVVFQAYSLFPWMRVQKNVEFGIEQANKELGRGLSKTGITEIARSYLDQVEMLPVAHKHPYQLSGGMRQRVAIARALAMDTEVLLFDEPFGALDVKTRSALQDLVIALWDKGEKRKTVLFITHDINEAILLADRVVFMRQGEILYDQEVELPRPRFATTLLQEPKALELKEKLTDLFYLDHGFDPDDDEAL